jgi:hypothetical protein
VPLDQVLSDYATARITRPQAYSVLRVSLGLDDRETRHLLAEARSQGPEAATKLAAVLAG